MSQQDTKKSSIPALSLAALGVVFGDIGTSPLYAFRQSLVGLPINPANVLGVLSLIFWTLILTISIKYLCLVFRADNDGEGGILSLLALLRRGGNKHYSLLFVLSIFGAGLMLGDGMLTPAMSVVSATEGLNMLSPVFTNWVLPISVLLLIVLFLFQSHGTAKIGIVFGPVILCWFFILAFLGIKQIAANPLVLQALNPLYGLRFICESGNHGYALLGGVFLVATGGEALYADLGHFGKKAIRLSWFLVALPGLVLNYFGQGAYVLLHHSAIANPFYLLAPGWFLMPLIILATLSTIIASQAVISATFSLTKQAVLLGLYPQIPIVQTSSKEKGQVYVPQINLVLAMGTLILVLYFKTSSAIAQAYGVAVNLVMILTTLLLMYVARKQWNWSVGRVFITFSLFLCIDVAFLGANVQKFLTGGWIPIVFACTTAFIMLTWSEGMSHLRQTYHMTEEQLSKIIKRFHDKRIAKLMGATAIFITDVYDSSGSGLLHFLRLNHALPEHIVMLNYKVHDVPYISLLDRFELQFLEQDIYHLTIHYGFMDVISIPQSLNELNAKQVLPFQLDINELTYLVEIPHVVATKAKKTLRFYWQEKLFAYLMRNYSVNLNIEFYQLPYNRTLAIGVYFRI